MKTDTDRLTREAAFHDAKVSARRPGPGLYGFGAGRHAVARLFHLLGDLNGKRVLDFGCGAGWMSVDLARRGAMVEAFDVSEESLKVARDYAAETGVGHKTHFTKDNAEALSFGDNLFDIVTGTGILHHLDIERAFREIHRVLKTGGYAFFVEPIGHNPIINFYRKLTPDIRTVDEHPLLNPQIRSSTSRFRHVEQEYFYLISLIPLVLGKALRSPGVSGRPVDALFAVDNFLLKVLPPLGRFCWSTLIILEK